VPATRESRQTEYEAWKSRSLEGIEVVCAQRLLSPACPAPLRNRRIVELSVGSLVAGTKYLGEFEESSASRRKPRGIRS